MLIRFGFHYFVLFAIIAMANAYLPLFLRTKGFTNANVGFLMGLIGMAGVAGPLVIGYLADRLNRRRSLLVVCLAGFVLLVVIMNNSAGLAVMSALAIGLGMVCRTPIPLTDSLTIANLPDASRQYGQVRVWGSLGYIIALLGIRVLGLVDEQSSASLAVAMIVPAVITMLTSVSLPFETASADAESASDSHGGFDVVFWIFLLGAGLHQLGVTSHYSFFSLYLHDVLDMDQAGWVWAVGPIFELPVVFFAGRILKKTGLTAALMAAMAAASLRQVSYALMPITAVVVSSQALHALSFGLYHVASIEFIRRKAPPARGGLAMALYMSLAVGLPSLLGSAVGGTIIERFGYSAMYLSYAVPPLLGIMCIAGIARAMPAKISPQAGESTRQVPANTLRDG